MHSLSAELRKDLERIIPKVRESAEGAAEGALNALAVNRPAPYPSLTPEQRQLRNALRVKARQLGGGSQTQGFQPLIEEIAYQGWHRMLFARFLAENRLLMHPEPELISQQTSKSGKRISGGSEHPAQTHLSPTGIDYSVAPAYSQN